VRGALARVAGPAVLALAVAGAARAQVAPNRAATYLVATDVTDARAIWVNPAGLATKPEASVLLDLTVARPGAAGRLGQVTAGFNARGLAFSYQRDNFPNGVHGHTYKLGFALGSGNLSGGIAMALYRGGDGGTGWDAGIRYDWVPQVTIGGVIQNLGQPTVRGIRQETVARPAITFRPLGSVLALSVQAAFGSGSDRGYTLEASAGLPRSPNLGLLARLDTDRSLHRRALVFGLSIGRLDRVGLVGSLPGDASRLDALSLYGVSTRTPH
jgi:hypothetical protein